MSPRFGSLRGLTQTDALAQRYGTTPAALLDEHDPYRAYCLSEAAAIAGQHAEQQAEDRAKAEAAPPEPPRRVHGLLVGTLSR